MADWWVSESVQAMLRQVNDRWPKRDRASDGILGNADHQASVSDHNPCWTCSGDRAGVVRALDLDASMGGKAGYNTTDDAWKLAKQIKAAMVAGDKRIAYVIAYDPTAKTTKIASMNPEYQPRGKWRTYGGASHINHIHVSFTPAGDFRPRKFDLPIITELQRKRLRKVRDALADRIEELKAARRRVVRKLNRL